MINMSNVAQNIVSKLISSGFKRKNLVMQEIFCLTEEVGEFVGAYRRFSGLARRSGPWSDVEEELADVVIAAWVVGEVIGVDLEYAIDKKLNAIFSRPWRELDPE